jgi:hypothetical protein
MPLFKRIMNFRVRLIISPLLKASESACIDGSPLRIALVAAFVNGFDVENAVMSRDKAATRMVGSRWSKKLPITSLFKTKL